MGFGDGNGQAIAIPHFANARADADFLVDINADGLDGGVGFLAIGAVGIPGINFKALVEIAIAGYIVIQTEDIGRARILLEPVQLGFIDSAPQEVSPHAVVFTETAAEKIKAEPAALIFEI